MFNKIIEYFTGFEFVKDLFLIALGAFCSFLHQMIKEKTIDKRRIKSIKKKRREYDEIGIISLANPYPFYKPQNLELTQSDEEFILDMNDCDKDKIFNVKSLEELGNLMGIEDFKSLVSDAREKVKPYFAENETGRQLFNNKKYGIRKMVLSDKPDVEEDDILKIVFYITDYFTHKVMREVYWQLKKKNHEISIFNRLEEIKVNKYFPFLTSFGINSILTLESKHEVPCIVLSQRSKFMANMDEDLWHVTMNEGLSITDKLEEDDRVSFERCVIRGYEEECGIKKKNHIIKSNFCDLFMVRDNFEIGLFVTSEVDMTQDDYYLCYEGAKDSHMETKTFKFINSRPESLRAFLRKNKMTDAGRYCLRQFISRNV